MIEKYSADQFLYGRLKEFAKENRQHETEAEAVLWNSIRNRTLGVKFLRQYIIDVYIVDFVCRESRLVIEVDGGYHAERTQQENDEIRTRRLQELGYRVIRFANDAILYDFENVKKRIMLEI